MLSLFKNPKSHSKNKLRKHFKKAHSEDNIQKVYGNFMHADNKKSEKKNLLKVIEMCYNNLENQIELALLLNLPFIPGPISLHEFPTVLIEQNQVISHKGDSQQGQEQTQLEFLFNYLKNVREYYYCWIIYFNEDLKILNVKLLKREEIEQHEDMFNPILNLIGIFINRTKEKHPKNNCDPVPKKTHYVEQYYGEGNHFQPIDQSHHNKSISTFNSSTGTTWKKVTNMEKINEDNDEFEEQNHKAKIMRKSSKLRKKEEKNHSLSKWNEQIRTLKKQNKSFSIKQLKQKSKSQILLNRSKSNIRQIILEPLKNETNTINHKFKALHHKTKLKKQSKTTKNESIYFKKPPME